MPHKPFPPSLLLLRQPFLRFPRSHHQPLRSSPLPSRTIIAPPRPGSGPLRERRPDRALPPIPRPWLIWARTLPLFILIVTVSTLGLFNYQKQSSSVVASTMYALRTSERGREVLGDEIYYRDWFPWIWGEMNQLHGRIDIRFGVKGTRGRGMMRFKCVRRQRMGYVSRISLWWTVLMGVDWLRIADMPE